MTNDTGITMPKGREYSVGLSTPPPPTISIRANDSRPLLTIQPDGTVTGEIEDASEAARVFVESLRGYLRQPTQSDALSRWQKGFNSGVEEAAKALEDDAKLCDCAALEERECGCGAWCEWKSITSARAVGIVRALQELKQ
jgi:hypothetical protein